MKSCSEQKKYSDAGIETNRATAQQFLENNKVNEK